MNQDNLGPSRVSSLIISKEYSNRPAETDSDFFLDEAKPNRLVSEDAQKESNAMMLIVEKQSVLEAKKEADQQMQRKQNSSVVQTVGSASGQKGVK